MNENTPSTDEHRQSASEHAEGHRIGCAVLTISDTRTRETDRGGQLIQQHLDEHEAKAFAVAGYEIVPDDVDEIDRQLESWITQPEIEAILTTGGTGISRRDTTIEVVERKLTARLDGFGELFRMLSWDEVGAAAMLSRSVAGLIARDESHGGDTFIFCMPGSTNAVKLAMSRLVVPELPHLIWERTK